MLQVTQPVFFKCLERTLRSRCGQDRPSTAADPARRAAAEIKGRSRSTPRPPRLASPSPAISLPGCRGTVNVGRDARDNRNSHTTLPSRSTRSRRARAAGDCLKQVARSSSEAPSHDLQQFELPSRSECSSDELHRVRREQGPWTEMPDEGVGREQGGRPDLQQSVASPCRPAQRIPGHRPHRARVLFSQPSRDQRTAALRALHHHQR